MKTFSTSDNAGHYTVPFLPPGEYQIQAEMTGFKSFVRSGIHLASGDQAVVDITKRSWLVPTAGIPTLGMVRHGPTRDCERDPRELNHVALLARRVAS